MSDDLTRLRQVVLRLSSQYDGEVVNAARAINRLLGSAGRDWHWFASAIGAGEPSDWEARVREAYELGRQSAQRNNSSQQDAGDDLFVDCSAAAEWLFDNHGSRLWDRDRDFLNTMLTWIGRPTEKQAQWLSSLCKRFGYRP